MCADGPWQRFTTLKSSDCVERELCTFFPPRRRVFIVVGAEKSPNRRIGPRQGTHGRLIVRTSKYKNARLAFTLARRVMVVFDIFFIFRRLFRGLVSS